MKNLKISLIAIIFAIITTIFTGVYAHGSQVDTESAITMPSALNNGTGNVTTALSDQMNYQFVEITSEKYATIKKYEAIYNLINAYVNSDSNYETLLAEYQQTYNETANAIINKYEIKFDEEGLSAIRGLWITELTTYNNNAWEKADGKTITMDLTTFKGTKYYIAWVKIGDIYDAEAYILTGTKQDDNSKPQDQNKTPEPQDQNKTPEPNGTTETPKDNNVNKPTNTVTPSTKQETTAASAGKTLPKTGVSSAILGLIAVIGASAGISYIKYRKIK